MMLQFTVPGKAIPQGSKRHVGHGIMVESSRELGPWRERVALAAHNAMLAAGAKPFVGAVAVGLEFVLPRPKSTPKRRTPPAIKRPDLDKLGRAIFDALTGAVLLDDAQVVDLHAHKRLAESGETPCVTVTIEEFPMTQCPGTRISIVTPSKPAGIE
jgi:crossover junction endodeoxyribonuclease RusA